MKAPLATSLSVLSRSLDRGLAAVKPLSPSEYLANAIAAQRYRWSRESARASELARTVDGLADPELVQRDQQVMPEPLGADQRGDDDHRQAGHDDLVDADQDIAARGRDQHLQQ